MAFVVLGAFALFLIYTARNDAERRRTKQLILAGIFIPIFFVALLAVWAVNKYPGEIGWYQPIVLKYDAKGVAHIDHDVPYVSYHKY